MTAQVLPLAPIALTFLSHRFSDIFAVLSQLPDPFEDDWIDAVPEDRPAVQQAKLIKERVRLGDVYLTGPAPGIYRAA